jgi:uncharacterized membrane protein
MELGTPISRGWRQALVLAGTVAFLVGLVDPLEGFVLILAGGALVTYESFRAGSRWRKVLGYGLALVVAGSIAMLGLTAIGGVGGDTGPSMWWALLALPYPIGALVLLVGGVLEIVEVFRKPREEESEASDDEATSSGGTPRDAD